MNSTQNKKLNQVTEDMLLIGADIGENTHFARACDWRGVEISRRAFKFKNSRKGFETFLAWTVEMQKKGGKKKLLVGCEPTGCYWFTFQHYLKKHGIRLTLVNPFSVNRSKELDDNSPEKDDQKDPKTIVGLIKDGRFCDPYVPEGIYAEIREAQNCRDQIMKQHVRLSNQIQGWLQEYFPEYLECYKKFDSESGMLLLRHAALPKDIAALGAEGINQIWRDAKLRAVGMKRAQTLVEAARTSVGIEGGAGARMAIQILVEDYWKKQEQLEMVEKLLEEAVMKVPNVEKLLAIKGVGLSTVAGFIAEVGDIGRFTDPKQIQKIAGLEIVKNSSGKKKGRPRISKRGRVRLRRVLYEAAGSLTSWDEAFHEVFLYYRKREKHPLGRMQARIAIACKVIRVFYVILKTGCDYDQEKLRSDIRRPKMPEEAA